MAHSTLPKEYSLYTGVSNRPLGWKATRPIRHSVSRSHSSAIGSLMKRWDGLARSSNGWDSLRRDPELWYPEGNCLVHLHGQGQSRRGPAFRVFLEALLANGCQPLLDRFMAHEPAHLPTAEEDRDNDHPSLSETRGPVYELYIPAPPTAPRGDAFLYHIATRNLFAWIFGKPLVGSHLGGALVGLLNSLSELRPQGGNNAQDIMDYMAEQGYADMRSQPDHALAILFFAEHFRFKDLWIDAFAHCVGMHDKLHLCPGFEAMSRASRALITRSRLAMDMRLDNAGKALSSFLSDPLSDTHLGLSVSARAHLDKFRSFLQSFYIAKLGHYPPTNSAFPKNIYAQMCSEFQKLYDYLVDSSYSSSDNVPTLQQEGIRVFQSIQAFDSRHKFQTLQHPWPLLPEIDETTTSKPSINRRLSFTARADKMKPDARLVAFASLTKATNQKDRSLQNCALVRAFRGFEKECVFSLSKVDKNYKLSLIDARKVRWILVYSIYQTLLSVTRTPEQVTLTQNVPYYLCVQTAGCPPWKIEQPLGALLRTQMDQTREDFVAPLINSAVSPPSESPSPDEIKPDIDYFALKQTEPSSNLGLATVVPVPSKRKSSVRRALSTLGNMPELRHPRPKSAKFHEILVHSYGNGTNAVNGINESHKAAGHTREHSIGSDTSSTADLASRWSSSPVNDHGVESPRTSISSVSRSGSDGSTGPVKTSIENFLDNPLSSNRPRRVLSSIYSTNIYSSYAFDEDEIL